MESSASNEEDRNQGLQEINKALLENMAFFSDCVWAIDLRTESIEILHDRFHDDVVGKKFTLEESVAKIKNNRHPDEDEILWRFSPKHLKSLTKSETFEIATFVSVSGKSHTYRCILTPESDISGQNAKVYLSIQDIQPSLDRMKENEIVKALSRDYLNVFIVDPRKKTVSIQKLDGFVYDEFNKQKEREYPYEDVLSNYIKEGVYFEDRDRLFSALEINNVLSVLEKKEEYVSTYRTLVDGEIHYFQFKILRLSEKHILAGFSNIDAVIREENGKFLKAMMRDYTNVYWLFPDDEIVEVVKQKGTPVIEESSGMQKRIPFDVAVDKYVSMAVHKDDKEKFLESISIENILHELAEKDNYDFIYRSVYNGLHYFQAKISRVESNKILVGFLNVDAAVAEESKRLRKVEFYNSVLNVCTKDYTNVYILNTRIGSLTVIKQKSVKVVLCKNKKSSTDLIHYDSLWEDYCMNNVFEEDKHKLLEFGSLERIVSALKTKDEVFMDYRALSDAGIMNYRIKWEVISETEILVSAQNITSIVKREMEERKIVEDALMQAREANKAKTCFLNNMSHDIRTPMNAIMGYTNLAAMHINEAERVADCLDKIQSSSNHLISLINNVLDMSRIEAGKSIIEEREASLGEILMNAVNMMQFNAENGKLDLRVDSSGVKDDRIMCDILRLNQVLINCISNSIKYTPAGGSVVLTVSQKPCSTKGFAVYEFKLKDNGIGMSEEFLDHIFEPFERERNTTMSGICGSGLGMAITKNIVDLMNGRIFISSKKGVGTEVTVTFSFRLAGENSGAVEKKNPESSSGKKPLEGVKILLVEDNLYNRDVTFVLLTDLGAKVDIAENGSVAVRKIQECTVGDYDVVLMDVQMPGMNGYEATREIRAIPDSEIANIPIIALTANSGDDEKKATLAVGMNAYVVKPAGIEVLTETIKGVLEKESDRKKSYRDWLTGLYTRNFMDKWIESHRFESVLPVSFVVIDCNDLKLTNDRLGHAAGDMMLQTMSQILMRSFPRRNSTVIRIGGDEFLVLCRGLQKSKVEECIASAREFGRNNKGIRIGFCCGVATVSDEAYEFSDIFNKAEELMLREKSLYHKRV